MSIYWGGPPTTVTRSNGLETKGDFVRVIVLHSCGIWRIIRVTRQGWVDFKEAQENLPPIHKGKIRATPVTLGQATAPSSRTNGRSDEGVFVKEIVLRHFGIQRLCWFTGQGLVDCPKE